MADYLCGHCGYQGPCYGSPSGGRIGVSAPWCPRCQRNDKLTTIEEVTERTTKFNAHLDICEQCERHPFNLCHEGAKLLKYAATGQQ